RHVQAARARHRAFGVDDGVAALDFAARKTLQRKRAALAGACARRLGAVRTHAANARGSPAGEDPHRIARADRTGERGAGDDAPEAVDGGGPVDVHSDPPASALARGPLARRALKEPTELRDSLAAYGRDAEQRRAAKARGREERLDFAGRLVDPLGRRTVDLGEHHREARRAEEP